ncbi:probable magnesium transporter NIPA6 [Lathyrus oleraceus]|uniref:probable magnesium transporter NIPA6 n=1 Tax=Pisum sativum TaxID=3888 RepID=UPI0021CFFB04|nr:probable magnesium transporter NIPA6 [Pisum sativum]
MIVKAIGIAIKLTFDGSNQNVYFQTWIFTMVGISCIITSLNHLNMALDTLNTTVVSPIYYALFALFTILAGAIMFKDYLGQSMSSIASELCGFIIVLSGTTVSHYTRIPDPPVNTDVYSPLSPKLYQHYKHNEEHFWRIQQQHKNQMQNLFDEGLYFVFLLKDQEWNLWCRTVCSVGTGNSVAVAELRRR